MFPLLNHLFIMKWKITLIDQFSKCQVRIYLQWDKSATVTFLWYVFSQNTYLFHRHCGRHSISRNRMSKVTQALRVGKDCPLQKATIKKKRFPTHYPLSFPLFLSITRAKKLQSFGAVHQGFLITCSFFYLFFFFLYYRMCVECLQQF